MFKRLFTIIFLCAMILPWENFSAKAAESISNYPYSENFDSTGDTSLPLGWATEGECSFSIQPAIDYAQAAYSGANILASGNPNATVRNGVAFTPMFKMKGGTEYTMTVYVKIIEGAYSRYANMKITTGQEQSADAHTNIIFEKNELTTDWEKIEYKFTPETDGEYCFGLWRMSNLANAGYVFYDSFTLTEAETEEPEFKAEIPYTENFDGTAADAMPQGWSTEGSTTFSVQSAIDYGQTAQTGDKLIASGYPQLSNRTDVAFSPMFEMKAGTEYTMTVYVKMPGIGNNRNPKMKITVGQAQVSDAHATILEERNEIISEWEKIECKFTPETDGEYCFGLWCNSGLSSAGDVYYDSFSITAAGEEEPAWKAQIPYNETFDDATHYSGAEYLPIGWLTSGDTPFITASLKSKPAVSGDYYIVAQPSVTIQRQDIAYSPMLEMKGGTTYNISLYLYMPGGETNLPSFKLTIGNKQETTAQTTVLEDIKDTRINDWTKIEKTFTPETDGEYSIALWACSENSQDGYICIENFAVIESGGVIPPTVMFYTGNTLNSVFNGCPVIFEDQEVGLVNASINAESYKWSVDGNATISDENAAEPTIKFPTSGTYNITLEASNEGGTENLTKPFTVIIYDTEQDNEDAFQTTSETSDKIYQQGDQPAFDENGNVISSNTYEVYYDYVVGVNPYYRSIAEKFELPADQTVTIKSITVNTMMYSLFISTIGENPVNDKDKGFKVVFYGDKDGKPDTSKPLYTHTGKLAEQFGESGYYNPVRQAINFDEPFDATGTFYVAFECDELDLENENDDYPCRSYIGFDTRQHNNKQTTLYVKPEKALPNSSFTVNGEYCRADEFCKDLQGYSFAVMPWVTIKKEGSASISKPATDELDISISINGDSYFINGMGNNTPVNVYSSSGTMVFSGTSGNGSIIIPANNWANGVYIIKAGNKGVKVVK